MPFGAFPEGQNLTILGVMTMRCKQCTAVLNSYYGPEESKNHINPDNTFDFCDDCYKNCQKCFVCEPKRPVSEEDIKTAEKILGEGYFKYLILCVNCAKCAANARTK
jgi:hypothetical protein